MDPIVAGNIFAKGWNIDEETKEKLEATESAPRYLDKPPKVLKMKNTKDRTPLEILFFNAIEGLETKATKYATLKLDAGGKNVTAPIQPVILTLLRALYLMSVAPTKELSIESATLLVKMSNLLSSTSNINPTAFALLVENNIERSDLRDLSCRWLRGV